MARPSRKIEVVTAAAELIAERGLLAVSFKDVAERAGVHLASIYRMFADMEELYGDVVKLAHEETERHAKAIFSSGAGAESIVKTVVYSTVLQTHVGSVHRRMFFRVLADNDRYALSRLYEQRKWGIEQFIAHLGRLADVGNPMKTYSALVSLTMGGMHFNPFFGLIDADRDVVNDPERRAVEVLSILLPGRDWAAVPLVPLAAEELTKKSGMRETLMT